MATKAKATPAVRVQAVVAKKSVNGIARVSKYLAEGVGGAVEAAVGKGGGYDQGLLSVKLSNVSEFAALAAAAGMSVEEAYALLD